MERGLSIRVLLLAVALLVGVATAYAAVAPTHAAAAITLGADDQTLVGPVSHLGVGAECGNQPVPVGDASGCTAAAPLSPIVSATTQFRVPAVGGAYSIQASFAGETVGLPTDLADDIVTISVTLGGINALAGPTTITILSFDVDGGGTFQDGVASPAR